MADSGPKRPVKSAAAMSDKDKLALMKGSYRKLKDEKDELERNSNKRIEELTAELEREKTTRQREVVELQSELDKSKELWRTLKEENERLIPLAEANRTEDVTMLGRAANTFSSIGLVDYKKMEADLRAEIGERDVALQEKELELNRLREAEASLSSSLETTSRDRDATLMKLKELEKRGDQQQTVLQACELDRANQTQDLAGKLAASQAMVAGLKEAAEVAEQREDTLRGDLAALQESMRQLHEEKQMALHEVKVLHQLREELSQAKAQVEQLAIGHQAVVAAQGRRSQPRMSPIPDTSCTGLDEVLSNSVRMAGFRDYARKQNAEGYLMFWQDVRDYRELTEACVDDVITIAQAAGMIYEKYLAPSAQKRVELSKDVCSSVQQKITAVNDNTAASEMIFDEAAQEVYMFLMQDLYPRYVQMAE